MAVLGVAVLGVVEASEDAVGEVVLSVSAPVEPPKLPLLDSAISSPGPRMH